MSNRSAARAVTRPVLPARVAWWMAAASGVWAAVLLLMEWPSQWWLGLTVSAWFGAATWVQTRWPWPGVVLTGGAILALGALGLPPENAAPLGPVMLALVTIGYLVTPGWSFWALPVLLAAVATTAVWDAPSIAFGAVLLCLPWWFGVLVRGRDARRRAAEADARRLARVDPAAHAREAALAEREGVAAAALETIGRGVAEMADAASDARASLGADAIAATHRIGEETVSRLLALLVVLRVDHGPPIPETEGPAAASAPDSPSRPSFLATLLGSWPAVLSALDVALVPVLMAAADAPDAATPPPVPFVLFTIVPLIVAVVLRNRYPAGAAWAFAIILAGGALTSVTDPGRDGFWLPIAPPATRPGATSPCPCGSRAAKLRRP